MRHPVAGSVSLLFLSVSISTPAADLEDVVVTATRTSQGVAETLAAVTVVTRSQIESRQARSLEDLLLGMEGLSIGNSGGPGRVTSFFVRGTDADHLLVLVDGIRVGSATAGTVALQNLPLEQIERIEFVRGPRSSLYGSEAIGGVLQVFTRRGGGPLTPEFSISGGSYGTLQGSASLQGGGERAWFSLQASAQSIDGFDACRGSSTEFAGCFTEEPDDDAYQYGSYAVRGGYRFSPGTELDGSFWRSDSKVDYDGDFANHSEITQQVAGVTLTQPLRSGGKVTVRAGRAWDLSDDFLDTAFMSTFDTQRDSASVQVDIPVATAHLLTLGVDYQGDAVSGTTDYEVTSRNDVGLFAQYVGTIGPWRVEASARADDNEQFGRHFTGGLGFGYQVSGSWGLVAQYGTAFRAPTFNELYYPYFGNPMLEPEQSQSVELAAKGQARGQGSALHWRVSLFGTEIDDLIGFDASFAPANIDAARIVGAEAGITITRSDWTVDTGITILDPKNRSAGANQGKQLPRRPEFTGRVDVERRFGRFTLGGRVASEGSRYDDSANMRLVPGFTVVDLRAEYRLASTWRVQARLSNLFDTRYETVAFYNQPGRAGYLTLRYGR